MKKFSKIFLTCCAVFIVFACICGFIDKSRASKNKEPIFCINQSGGSIICYIGPGYVITGAWDDNPGGLEYTKIHTWIYWITGNI